MIDFPRQPAAVGTGSCPMPTRLARRDRKSTRLNSSHLGISYAVFCLKKKKKNEVEGVAGVARQTAEGAVAARPAGPGQRPVGAQARAQEDGRRLASRRLPRAQRAAE